MLTIQAEIIVLVGVQLFTSFCSKCFVSDVDKIHISGTTEGGVSQYHRMTCSRRGRVPKSCLAEGIRQLTIYVAELESFRDRLRAADFKPAEGASGPVAKVEMPIEELEAQGREDEEREKMITDLSQRLSRASMERDTLMKEQEELEEQLAGAKALVKSLRHEVKNTRPPTAASHEATPAVEPAADAARRTTSLTTNTAEATRRVPAESATNTGTAFGEGLMSYLDAAGSAGGVSGGAGAGGAMGGFEAGARNTSGGFAAFDRAAAGAFGGFGGLGGGVGGATGGAAGGFGLGHRGAAGGVGGWSDGASGFGAAATASRPGVIFDDGAGYRAFGGSPAPTSRRPETTRRPARVSEDERDPWASPGAGAVRGGSSSTLKIVSDTVRLVKETLDETSDVIEFILQAESLRTGINDFLVGYGEEIKILVAKVKCSASLKPTATEIQESMRSEGRFNLTEFFDRIFVMRFPKALSSLELGFRKINQNNPTKVSIVEYGTRFKLFVRKLGLSLRANYLKFIEGLANPEVRMALLRFPFQDLEFQDLIATCVGVENSLTVSRSPSVSKSLVVSDTDAVLESYEECGWGDGVDQVFKIHGVSLMTYIKALEKHNIKRKCCFQCLQTSHLANKCFRLRCRFCQKPSAEVGHLSLLCPQAPSDLSKLVKEGGSAATSKVKLASDEDSLGPKGDDDGNEALINLE